MTNRFKRTHYPLPDAVDRFDKGVERRGLTFGRAVAPTRPRAERVNGRSGITPRRPSGGRARFTIRSVGPDDSAAIAGYLAEDFGHVYLHLFAASPDVQRTILEEFIRHTEDLPVSYRSFLVAVDARSGAVIGVLGVHPTSPSAPVVPIQDVLKTVEIVANRLGVGGLSSGPSSTTRRFWRTCRRRGPRARC